MASRRPLDYPVFQAFDDNGAPLSSGTVEFFDAGTTDQRNTFSDPELTVTNPNPVTLNSRGEPQSGGGSAISIYLDGSPYKIVVKDSGGATVRTIDDYLISDVGNEWINELTATKSDTDTFTLPGDETSEFHINRRILIEDFNTLYGTISGSTYSAGSDQTTIDVDLDSGSFVNSTFSVFLSITSADNPSISDRALYKKAITATDTGTDTFEFDFGRDITDEERVSVDFDGNTTTTPTLENTGGLPSGAKTLTTRDGSALWPGAVSGVHDVQYDSGADTYLVLEPLPTPANVANSPMSRNASAHSSVADPTASSHIATKGWTETNRLALPGTSSNPSLAFDTWRTPNANRPTLVELDLYVSTDGSSNGQILVDVDESGGTTQDYNMTAFVNSNQTANADAIIPITIIVPAGGAYRIRNASDPNGNNAVRSHREFTL